MVSQEILVLLSSSAIISAFYIQGQAYFRPAIYAQAVQSLVISAIAFFLGLTLSSPDYIALGLAVVVLRSVLVTFFLFRGLRKRPGIRESTRGVASELTASLAFFTAVTVVLYYFFVAKLGVFAEAGNNILLLFAIALFFQGLFLMASRRSTIFQFLGYIEEENAVVLLGVFLLPIPFLVELSIFLDVLGLVVVSSVITLEKPEHARLEELRG